MLREPTLICECPYGENPQQSGAALYADSGENDPLAIYKFSLLAGKPIGFNGFCEIDRLLQTVTHAVAGLQTIAPQTRYHVALGSKHGNCCGAAYAKDATQAVRNMLSGDPRAIFGGTVLLTDRVTAGIAQILTTGEEGRRLLDMVVAPEFDDAAIEILSRKRGKCRLVANPHLSHLSMRDIDTSVRRRYVRGGYLTQDNYTRVIDVRGSYATRYGALTSQMGRDLTFAWAIGSTSTSNTITLVKNEMLIGNGVGQQDRVGAAELAIKRARDAKHETAGAVAYSDSFFPFADGPQALIDAGISAILASSGSIRDKDVVGVCESTNTALVMIPDEEGRGFYGH